MVSTSKFKMVIYADDTTLVFTLETFGSQTNINSIENRINIEIKMYNQLATLRQITFKRWKIRDDDLLQTSKKIPEISKK